MDEEQLQDALNQVAVEQLRADQAEDSVKSEKARADKAEAERDEYKTQLEALRKERADVDVDKLKRQIRALSDQVNYQKHRADKAESPETIRDKVRARVSLQTRAVAVLGEDARFDDMSDRELMSAVVEKLHGTKLEDKSEDYVRARFDSAVEGYEVGAKALARVRQAVEEREEEKATRKDNRSARQKFIEDQASAWKQETR